jgi:hypothetical protein
MHHHFKLHDDGGSAQLVCLSSKMVCCQHRQKVVLKIFTMV